MTGQKFCVLLPPPRPLPTYILLSAPNFSFFFFKWVPSRHGEVQRMHKDNSAFYPSGCNITNFEM